VSAGDAELSRMTRAELVAAARARGLAASGWETREELLRLLGVRTQPQRGLLARAREILTVAREALGLADLVFDSRVDAGSAERPWARTRAEEAAERARLERAAAAKSIEHSFVTDEDESAGGAASALLDALAGAGAALDAGAAPARAAAGADARADRAAEPGAAAGADAGAEAGAEAGPEAGAEAGPEAGADAGPEAGAEAGPETGAEPGVGAGGETGAGAGGEPGADTEPADFVAATAQSDRALYVTWRLTGAGVARARAKLGGENGALRPVLRLVLWDLGAEAERHIEDHPIDDGAGERVLPLPEGGAVYVAAVGMGAPGGPFAPAAHCPRGSTTGPRHAPLPRSAVPPDALDAVLPAPTSPEALAAAVALEPAPLAPAPLAPAAPAPAPPAPAAPAPAAPAPARPAPAAPAPAPPAAPAADAAGASAAGPEPLPSPPPARRPPPALPSFAAQRRALRREDRRKLRVDRRGGSERPDPNHARARRDRNRRR